MPIVYILIRLFYNKVELYKNRVYRLKKIKKDINKNLKTIKSCY